MKNSTILKKLPLFFLLLLSFSCSKKSKLPKDTGLSLASVISKTPKKVVPPKLEVPSNYPQEDWTLAPSLKQAFVDGGYFERLGIACESGEILNSEIAKGLAYQANSTTPGNECKPQFIFWYPKPSFNETFTDSSGTTIKVPTKINFGIKMDPFLKGVSDAKMQMRGHVLVWHSQTFDWFFTKDYSDSVTYDENGNPNNLADKKTMTARQEWYIKSVLEHAAQWEEEHGYAGSKTEKESGKKHLIYAWDVVNEAAADDAKQNGEYLRGATVSTKNKSADKGGSRWYQIYGDDSFIVNAFRFANAYAPKDVLLVYNDYNTYLEWTQGYKTSAIKTIVKNIQKAPSLKVNGKDVKPRIDVVGMQCHVGDTYPSLSGVETAIKSILDLNVDIHVTEFDIATKKKSGNSLFAKYMNLFMKYSKSKGTTINGKGITGVTYWGINDENSWISKNGSQFPLLFTKKGNTYYTKDCFYEILKLVE